jgi:hypothetical protein
VVGFTTGSRGKVPGKTRERRIRTNNNNDNNKNNRDFITDKPTIHNRPDITLVDKGKNYILIDISIPYT